MLGVHDVHVHEVGFGVWMRSCRNRGQRCGGTALVLNFNGVEQLEDQYFLLVLEVAISEQLLLQVRKRQSWERLSDHFDHLLLGVRHSHEGKVVGVVSHSSKLLAFLNKLFPNVFLYRHIAKVETRFLFDCLGVRFGNLRLNSLK